MDKPEVQILDLRPFEVAADRFELRQFVIRQVEVSGRPAYSVRFGGSGIPDRVTWQTAAGPEASIFFEADRDSTQIAAARTWSHIPDPGKRREELSAAAAEVVLTVEAIRLNFGVVGQDQDASIAHRRRQVKRLWKEGLTYEQIKKKVGYSRSTVRNDLSWLEQEGEIDRG